MTCREFLDEVESLALGHPAPPRAEPLRAHAAACPSCAARLKAAEDENARLRGLRASFAPSPALVDRVREALRTGAPPAPRAVRLWRWAPAAAALLFAVLFTALFLAGPGPAVPPIIADTLAAYEAVSAGDRTLDIASGDPAAVRAHFPGVSHLAVPEPRCCDACTCPPGGCRCTLKGACHCSLPSAGKRIPCVVYDHGGTPLAMLHIGAGRLGPEALARAERVDSHGHPVYVFRHGNLTVTHCPACGPSTLWVSRLDAATLVAAQHAMLDPGKEG
mgnify:CR=1 FL=1